MKLAMNKRDEYRRKILTLIGFAKKSGNITSGTELVMNSISKVGSRVYLVFIARDASPAQSEKVENLCLKNGIPFCKIFDRDELSKTIGEADRICIAVKKRQFSNAIQEFLTKLDIYDTGGVEYGENESL